MRVFRSGSIVGVIALTVLQSAAFAQNTFDRSKPPELGPPPRMALPPIVTRELPNGLKLMIVEQHEQKPGDCGSDRISRHWPEFDQQLGVEHDIPPHSYRPTG